MCNACVSEYSFCVNRLCISWLLFTSFDVLLCYYFYLEIEQFDVLKYCYFSDMQQRLFPISHPSKLNCLKVKIIASREIHCLINYWRLQLTFHLKKQPKIFVKWVVFYFRLIRILIAFFFPWSSFCIWTKNNVLQTHEYFSTIFQFRYGALKIYSWERHATVTGLCHFEKNIYAHKSGVKYIPRNSW